MNIQGFFTKQTATIYDIKGEVKAIERIHLTRQGISNNDFSHTHKFKGLLGTDTVLDEGDLVIVDKEPYLVMAMRKIVFAKTNQASLLKCDDICSVYKLESQYDGNIKIGIENIPVKRFIPCVQRDTNTKTNYFDAGLLDTTIKVVYMQFSPDIELGHRLVINKKNYKIDSIDLTVKNVMILQLSPDKREVDE